MKLSIQLGLLFPLVFLCLDVFAQGNFFKTVRVAFEKTVYVKQLYKEIWDENDYNRWASDFPPSATAQYEYIGDTVHSVFKPIDARQQVAETWGVFLIPRTVYTNFESRQVVALKPLYEKLYRVEDTIPSIKWRLTSDTRLIAGFECHKAVGIMNDSIAIFAFYADELLPRGGPEGVTGLPGLILGMAVPKLHTTWFATGVQVLNVPAERIVPSNSGTRIVARSFVEEVKKLISGWGQYGRTLLISFVI